MKKSIALLLTLILAIGILPFGVSASENIYVTVDGATLNFDQPPIMQNDRVLVPMRLIFETLGATVEWDEYNQYVKATKEDISITMQIGNSTMVKNGQYITLDTAPILLNGRTLVPVRAVAESLEATVEWRGEINTVVIEQKVIPKRYATETVVYAPDAKSIITDKDNNIYYIQDNKVMIYKNGIASVFVDVDQEYADVATDEKHRACNCEVYGIVYDSIRNTIIAGMAGRNSVAYDSIAFFVDLKTQEVLVPYAWGMGQYIILNGNTIYSSNGNGVYGMSNLSTSQSIRYDSPVSKFDKNIFSVVNEKLCFLNLDSYQANYFQYDPAKNSFIQTTLQKFDTKLIDVYLGTDGTNFYYTRDFNIYQVTPTKQVNQWLSYEEIDFQDQTAITGEGVFTFDQEGNILFYDDNVESIRRIKKLN